MAKLMLNRQVTTEQEGRIGASLKLPEHIDARQTAKTLIFILATKLDLPVVKRYETQTTQNCWKCSVISPVLSFLGVNAFVVNTTKFKIAFAVFFPVNIVGLIKKGD